MSACPTRSAYLTFYRGHLAAWNRPSPAPTDARAAEAARHRRACVQGATLPVSLARDGLLFPVKLLLGAELPQPWTAPDRALSGAAALGALGLIDRSVARAARGFGRGAGCAVGALAWPLHRWPPAAAWSDRAGAWGAAVGVAVGRMLAVPLEVARGGALVAALMVLGVASLPLYGVLGLLGSLVGRATAPRDRHLAPRAA